MSKIVRNVATYDDVLRALPPGKLLVTAATWQGNLGPQIDAQLAKLEPLISGFTSGRVLHAEPAPEELNPGRLWIGSLRDQIASVALVSVRGGQRTTEPMVDVREALAAVESVRNALEANRVDFGLVTDSLRKLRRVRDSVLSSAAYGSGSAAEAGTADKTTTSDALRTFGDRARASTRDALSAIRANARTDFYPHQATHPVDAHARGTRQTQDLSTILALARQGSPFTGSGQQSYQSGGARRTGNFSAGLSPAELNQRARDFWKDK